VKAVGVLALQGDFAAHARVLRGLGADVREVRCLADLDGCARWSCPAARARPSSLMDGAPWLDELRTFHARRRLLGTCAGAILLARESLPAQPSLGLLDAVVERNGYGRRRTRSRRSSTRRASTAPCAACSSALRA
jgi:5'-phosphate synthase pdxT subunit